MKDEKKTGSAVPPSRGSGGSGRRGGHRPLIGLLAVLLPAAARAQEPAVAKHPDRVELVAPAGVKLYGGADLESRVDRAGVIFVAATGRVGKDFGAVMWKQAPRAGGWASAPIDLGDLYVGGRGSLTVDADGRLDLTVWGRDSRAYRLRVPGWTP